MQILQRLLKTAQEPPSRTDSRPSPINKKEGAKGDRRVKSKSKDIQLSLSGNSEDKHTKKRAEQTGLDCSHPNFLKFLRKDDIAKACFYRTINLKRVRSSRRREYFVKSMKMKKEDLARGLGMISSHKAENKVLPISDNQNSTTPSSSSTGNEIHQCGTNTTSDAGAAPTTAEKKEKTKGDKARTLSKMKELLRWAAAAKAEKGGKYISRKILHFRNRAALKSVPDDDQMSNESPKISFRWEVESCSTISSSYSAISSIASSSMNFDHASIRQQQPSLSATPIHAADTSFVRTGNWITTDSEFVVLEL